MDDERDLPVPGAAGGPLRKALAVLEVLAEAPGPLTLSELSRLADLPKSTLHRLMRVLTDNGLAVRKESKSYELGTYLSRLAATGGGPPPAHGPDYPVTPFLLDLFRRTNRIVSLGTLAGTRVRHTGTLYGQEHARLAMALRQPVPAHTSAAGRLLLAMAGQNPADVLAATAPGSRALPARTDAMRREFARIRRTGLSYARSERIPELVELAAPVRLGRTGPPAAIVVADTATNRDLRSVARTLLNTVDAIERDLAAVC
ncbi:helix-turn-helix domain-containing protein [Streptomyces olivaceus]|uniref:IclR family transcriptional regulator n=1 Tax=Streptomyces olivaceus TaxID=47716 RepID=UPI001CCD1C48|nr:helix-turn-helix domain-containing protein [Streptomyces olivaceus]MBZ6174597.1 helix-turn-helix domain-containing protein [Streptomyces olivaceus]MBZ6180776.1 helix-turn-helix domain-containing protein [Streptomyces olivaceus]MBZ6253161.1 helix-turn-helix domain-containing protein [Streptomyces olivaceus]